LVPDPRPGDSVATWLPSPLAPQARLAIREFAGGVDQILGRRSCSQGVHGQAPKAPVELSAAQLAGV